MSEYYFKLYLDHFLLKETELEAKLLTPPLYQKSWSYLVQLDLKHDIRNQFNYNIKKCKYIDSSGMKFSKVYIPIPASFNNPRTRKSWMFGDWVDFAEAVVGVSVSGEDSANGRIVGAEEEEVSRVKKLLLVGSAAASKCTIINATDDTDGWRGPSYSTSSNVVASKPSQGNPVGRILRQRAQAGLLTSNPLSTHRRIASKVRYK